MMQVLLKDSIAPLFNLRRPALSRISSRLKTASGQKKRFSVAKYHLNTISQETVHHTAKSGFQTSKLYDQVRPTYPKEAVKLLIGKLGISRQDRSSNQPLRILELGAGTGKFTDVLQKVLRDSNVEIIASEPVLSMREEFEQKFPTLGMKDFSAENIGLPNGSVHAVIAAQCFHWFANEKSLSEIQRVLVPGGKLGLVWNVRDHSVPWVKEMDDDVILPLYVQSNTPKAQSGEWKRLIMASDKFGSLEGDESFKTEQILTLDEFVKRLLSISVIAIKSEKEKKMEIDKIKSILNKHKLGTDTVILPYKVEMYWCERA